jgi:hypothetical protein
VKTVVVMVPPSALAETVTPSIFSPVADLIDPLSVTSAALADGVTTARARPMAVVAARLKAVCLQIMCQLS